MEMISSEIKIGMQECILHHMIQSQTTKIGEPEKILKIINFCAQSECRVICNFYSNLIIALYPVLDWFYKAVPHR